jgi:hypothetical protein
MKSFLYGNYFYAVCVVALSIESTLQQQIHFAPIVYYLAIFCVTVVYYTKAYIAETIDTIANERSAWYVKNKKSVFNSQVLLSVLSIVFGMLLLPNIVDGIKNLNLQSIVIILIFPAVGLLYYGLSNKLSLRNTHWLKPFVIGFVWSGVVTLFPLFYSQLQTNINIVLSPTNCMLFVKNLMFIAVLCIMFDIKDYATDYNQHLKTFVVSFGLRKTIFFILIPLTSIGFVSFLVFTTIHHFSTMRIIINTMPFLFLFLVAYSLHKRKSIFYYLVIIDGLMLVKAICGSIAMLY